ncbi:signal peptidase I [Hoyosella sp. G463]|uniref:Signal peptidase I n=1 Tax=Lolliginicoccus lacisalsi TaxID=2742202 RepID=A0A927PKH1_9ACTN|nr:signal peptidase I [Lolliginicoccus lacisalsi]MBD8505713.1 signal peptidase I [Lolliginicoccus lacisalsi]
MSSRSATRRSIPARIGHLVRESLLNLLAVSGLVCIVLVIIAVVFNISLIMFKTGSMNPTIPQGSLAVVREVPATSVEVGDIVTVDRGRGRLPVTHRVIGMEPGPDGTTHLTMQGDANPQPDPAIYRVSTVREMVTSFPGLAHVVVRLSDPRVMGLITILAALLVGWAFWPLREYTDDDADGEGTTPAVPTTTGTSA